MSSKTPSYPVRSLRLAQQEAIQRFGTDPQIHKEAVACLICASEDYQVLFRNERHGIDQDTVMCTNCGLVYSNPRMNDESVHYFYESDLYRQIYSGVNDQNKDNNLYSLSYDLDKTTPRFEKYYYQLFFDFIQHFDLSYESVCEVGAGGGWNLVPFSTLGKKVKGYEPSPRLCQLGREKGIDLTNGFVNDVKGQYDLVILKHVLEHFQNPFDVLKDLRPHVNKYLFIEVPGIQSMMPSLQNAHTYYFSLNTLEHITAEAGYAKLGLSYCESNDFIFGLFEKSEEVLSPSFSFQHEVSNVRSIYKAFTKALNRARFLEQVGIRKLYRRIKGS